MAERKRSTGSFTAVLVLLPLLCNHGALARERVEMFEVPAAVMKAAEEHAQGRKPMQAYSESDNTRKIYELRQHERESGWIEFNFEPNGALIETETKISIDQVPQVVMESLEYHPPGFKVDPAHIERAERLVELYDGSVVSVVWYEFDEGIDQNGQMKDVEVAEDGTRVLIEVEVHQRRR